MRLFSTWWMGIRMPLVHAVLFSATALITFLLRDVVPTSYAGASLVYTFQVREHIRWCISWFTFLPRKSSGNNNNNGLCNLRGSLLPLRHHGGSALSCKKQSCWVQCHAWLNDLIHRALIRAETPAVKEPGSEQRRRKETRWLDFGTMAVGAQCHVGCDGCSHTSNILRVAKCATGRKCCSGHVFKKDDQIRYALR